jgi:hypothetical protein
MIRSGSEPAPVPSALSKAPRDARPLVGTITS